MGTEGVKEIKPKTVGKTPDNGYGTKPVAGVASTPSMEGGAAEHTSNSGSVGPAPDAYPDIHQ